MQRQPSRLQRLRELTRQGVVILNPDAVDVDQGIHPDRIAPGVVIHSGCRILGEETSIGPGCEIGAEGPATVDNCQLGRNVSLKGGYFAGSTFLDGSSVGSWADVRAGTLLEEQASGAHTVGFKQTIFLPFVTAGSLINLCDCLIAGGTSRKNHSEVGSSYVHFNFTPHQDKATASLIGDVPRGVMLDQAPIFLGGQGGLVGPVRVAYGTVIPAGVLCREDILEENQLFSSRSFPSAGRKNYAPGLYRRISRIVLNNLMYIGNLRALEIWYRHVRSRMMEVDPFAKACWAGALSRLESAIEERIRRLRELAEKMPCSLEKARMEIGCDLPEDPYGEQQALIDKWPEMELRLKAGPEPGTGAPNRDLFLEEWEHIDKGTPYLKAVGLLDRKIRTAGTAWLQAIVDTTVSLWEAGSSRIRGDDRK